MEREGSLDTDAERLLADGEGLADAFALALDDDPLEDLGAATVAFDDLEVNLHAVARREVRHAAQLGLLKLVDDCAHKEVASLRDAPAASAAGSLDAREAIRIAEARRPPHRAHGSWPASSA